MTQPPDKNSRFTAALLSEAVEILKQPPSATLDQVIVPRGLWEQIAAALESAPSSTRQTGYPRDNALEVARDEDVLALAWKAAFGNETLKHPEQSLLARSFLAIAAELDYRDGGHERITGRPVSAIVEKTGDARMIPNDEWEKLAEILHWVQQWLDSTGDLSEYAAMSRVEQGMKDLKRLLGTSDDGAEK